jgi:hypothetical protein
MTTSVLWRVALVVACIGVAGIAWGQAPAKDASKDGYAVGAPVAPGQGAPAPKGVRDLVWNDLLPKDWNPRRLLAELDLGKMKDNDPRANELLARIRAEWDRAPVVKELDGARIRLPGFVVMLEGTPKGITEFLLVPYFGACIHVPPPPSNQLVHVFPQQPVPEDLSALAVSVTGTLTIAQAHTKMGAAGYRLSGAQVEKYARR